MSTCYDCSVFGFVITWEISYSNYFRERLVNFSWQRRVIKQVFTHILANVSVESDKCVSCITGAGACMSEILFIPYSLAIVSKTCSIPRLKKKESHQSRHSKPSPVHPSFKRTLVPVSSGADDARGEWWMTEEENRLLMPPAWAIWVGSHRSSERGRGSERHKEEKWEK